MAACWASSSSSWAWETNNSNNNNSSSSSLLDAGMMIQPLNFKQQDHSNFSRDSAATTVMGLRLGKRTYFEDAAAAAAAKDHPAAPLAPRKKQRSPSQPPATPLCQVQGCNADLSGSKGYHRRHRVCEVHSKTPKNIVGGIEQRFCQQCSRFHVLAEFDEGKRSCRRRLAGHNERRRKPPPPEAFAIHSALLGTAGSSPIFQQGDPNRNLLSVQQQQRHQHLLDGTFIGKANWPDSSLQRALLQPPPTTVVVDHHLQPQQQQLVTNNFFLNNNGNRDNILNQGVYQFLKCASSSSPAIASDPSFDGLPSRTGLPVSLPIEPGIVTSAGALSLLSSAEQWGTTGSASQQQQQQPNKMMVSSSSSDLSAVPLSSGGCLQLPIDDFHLHSSYHHHHHQQQQQQQQSYSNSGSGQFNDFMQFQKPLKASLVFDA